MTRDIDKNHVCITGDPFIDSLHVASPETLERWFRMRAMPFILAHQKINFTVELRDDHITPLLGNGLVMREETWKRLSEEVGAFYAKHDDAAVFEVNAARVLREIEALRFSGREMDWTTRSCYVARTVESPLVTKIGTAHCCRLYDRMRQLANVAKRPIDLLQWFPTGKNTFYKPEKLLHGLFNHRQVIGEWFALEDADLAWLRANLPPTPAEGVATLGVYP